MIKTEVTLTSGEKVDAYYLDEKDKENFVAFSWVKIRLENLDDETEMLRRVAEKDMIAYFETQIMEKLSINKSVHSWDFLNSLTVPNSFYRSLRKAWGNLLEKGTIEERGSGWFRRRKVDG